jgi:hypothetical protein
MASNSPSENSFPASSDGKQPKFPLFRSGREASASRDQFELLWPLIPGSVFTLIGVYFLLLSEQWNAVVMCYVGLMSLIVAAGKIWMQCIDKQPEPIDKQPEPIDKQPEPIDKQPEPIDRQPEPIDKQPEPIDRQLNLESAERRAQNKTASQNAILVICCFVGMVVTALAIVCGATVALFKGGTATGLFWAFALLSSGGFIGLLFAIPSENEPKDSNLHINTSLNQIADWLTKIIVGVSLVDARQIIKYFGQATGALGIGLTSGQDSSVAKVFAEGLIATFFLLGFTGTYLLARVWLTLALVRADQLAITLVHDAKRDRNAKPIPVH